MKQDIELIDVEKHHDLKVRCDYTFEHGKNLQFVALNAIEFAEASTCYPIFFIKDKRTGRFFPIALMGLAEGENLFYSSKIWSVPYVPKMLSLEPFSMASVEAPDGDRKWVPRIDVSSPLLDRNQGEALFQDGRETAFMVTKRDELIDVYNGKAATSFFVDRLLSDRLIKPVKFDLEFLGGQRGLIEGLYIVDGDRVRDLPDVSVVEFYRRGYLSAIYAMLTSQFNLFDLIRRRQVKDEIGSKNKLMSVQVLDV